MVLDSLGESLRSTLKKVTGASAVDKKLILELVKDVQRALLQADVNVRLVLNVTTKIRERALNEKPPAGVNSREFIIKVVYDELVNFLGGPGSKISVPDKQFRILLVGLFGHGKTTTAGKLGNYFKKRGKKVALISTDTWRPAAFEQLSQLGKQVNIPVFGDPKEKKPEKIFKKFEKELKAFDVVLIDSAGRDALNKELITELDTLNKAVKPDETLLVMSGDVGQGAEEQAKTFHDTVNVTGVLLTKLDGTAKGGGALIACSVTEAPVKFIGVGEKIDELEEFKPEGFVGRLLGMGDLEALLEKTKGIVTEEEAEEMSKKLLKGDFTLLDLYDQMKAMKKMGSFSKLANLIPGMSAANIPKDMLEGQEGKLELWRHAMDSMTQAELEDPELISASRVDRIAKGSALPTSDVRSLLKQYRQAKKLMKMMKGGDAENVDVEKMMQKMQKRKKLKLR